MKTSINKSFANGKIEVSMYFSPTTLMWNSRASVVWSSGAGAENLKTMSSCFLMADEFVKKIEAMTNSEKTEFANRCEE